MTELEQIRKELNEMRERIAVLEKRPVAPLTIGPANAYPPTTQNLNPSFYPRGLGDVWCGDVMVKLSA